MGFLMVFLTKFFNWPKLLFCAFLDISPPTNQYGEGKRQIEFADWHVARRADLCRE